jgi:hypothetical protein
VHGHFVSERISPVGNDFALPPAIGEPALPLNFQWGQDVRKVVAVPRHWKAIEADRTHGGSERYLRRHWFELQMDNGATWTIYFQRQPGSGRTAKARWWLYALADDASGS